MIMMMVSDQDVAQYPTLMRRQPCLHGRGITRIDHGAALGVVVL
jgi:hypothetical protein